MERYSNFRLIDKSSWPRGLWDAEPDRVEWTTEAGLPAIIVRRPLGALCGYVAVQPGHPLHGTHYECNGVWQLEAHGGVNYSAACQGDVCHVAKSGEPDDVWWFGFDCGHGYDRVPGVEVLCFAGSGLRGETYRDLTYVTGECEMLAKQLVQVGAS